MVSADTRTRAGALCALVSGGGRHLRAADDEVDRGITRRQGECLWILDGMDEALESLLRHGVERLQQVLGGRGAFHRVDRMEGVARVPCGAFDPRDQ